MIGTGANPASLMAAAVLTRSARSAPSGNARYTGVPAGMTALADTSPPSSFEVMSREKSASSAPQAAATASRRRARGPGAGLGMEHLQLPQVGRAAQADPVTSAFRVTW